MMIEFFSKLPWYVKAVVGVVLVVGLFGLFSQVQSCNYDKARKEYEAQSEQWKGERAKLIAEAESKEKRVAELESEVLAYKAAADAGKKVDDALAEKIEKLGEDAKHEEEVANSPVDCATRGARICTLLRANNITADCAAIVRESCTAR
jgi:uncharacterized protein YlxW (UPF0749 family)